LSLVMASFGVPAKRIGSIKCFASESWLQTQFGEAGQGVSLPSLTPKVLADAGGSLNICRLHARTESDIQARYAALPEFAGSTRNSGVS
jgi:hypothetical protein